MAKRITAAAINALVEALTNIYWYKTDQRRFLHTIIKNPSVLGRINWDEQKRTISSSIVSLLNSNPEVYFDDLLSLIDEVCQIDDFRHLLRLPDGKERASQAKNSVDSLRKHAEGFFELKQEKERTEQRRQESKKQITNIQGFEKKLAEIFKDYSNLVVSQEPQKRGFLFEKILKELFILFDLDPRPSFRTEGEQIDGAFTFDSTDYLLEAKWQQSPIIATDIDALHTKLQRRLDKTLGLLVSVYGFAPTGISAYQNSGRRLVILMDGEDLMAVLDGRIRLNELLLLKRKHASDTGNVFYRVRDILM